MSEGAAYYLTKASVSLARTDLLLPVQDADDGQDEDADADERDGRQQDDVARREVQLGTPTVDATEESERQFNLKIQFYRDQKARQLMNESTHSFKSFPHLSMCCQHTETTAFRQD